MDVRVGLWRRLSAEELMLLNCGLEKTLEGPLDCKEIQPVHSEGDQPWDFFGRTDAKAETPVLWPPHAKSWLIGKDSDAGRDWGQEKGTTEDEMAERHHGLDQPESGWTPGDGDGQGGLACCHSWGRKESDTAERLNWTELNWLVIAFLPGSKCLLISLLTEVICLVLAFVCLLFLVDVISQVEEVLFLVCWKFLSGLNTEFCQLLFLNLFI